MRHSCRYLLEDDRRSFSTIVAIALGERAAMIIQEIHHWVSEHFRAKDKRYLYDGAYWIWNSYKQWKKTFPFIPEPSLKKIILGLESQGILVSGEFNKNRGDRTKWYRINYDLLEQTLLPAEAEYNRICEEALDRKQPPSDLVQPPSDLVQPPSDLVQPPSDLVQPPSDLGDPLCTTDLSTDLSTDQARNTRADDFCMNSSSTQIQESLPHAQTKNPNIQDPQTPKPLSPVTPENKPNPIIHDRMAERFADKGGSRKAQTMPLLDDDDFLRYLLAELRKTKSYFKDLPDKNKLAPAKEYIRKSWLLGTEGEVRFADLQEYVRDYEKYKEAEAIATKQRQVEQQRFEQPAEDDSERVDVSEVLANLKRKKLLRNSQAA